MQEGNRRVSALATFAHDILAGELLDSAIVGSLSVSCDWESADRRSGKGSQNPVRIARMLYLPLDDSVFRKWLADAAGHAVGVCGVVHLICSLFARRPSTEYSGRCAYRRARRRTTKRQAYAGAKDGSDCAAPDNLALTT